MTIKKHKSNYKNYDDDEYDYAPKKSLRDHRRPIKNWKKAWTQYDEAVQANPDDNYDVDEFFNFK